ncbi:SpoIIE family protein phosphatase [Desulfonema magnum]|uniref:PPM-type phosphatase and HAMP domains-containing protein n=1 Tax=Desulfonema magnum TaxID=45655 RepID=A0A975BT44_9BACT|nr:SpoIIE family protein phosphatase [Desulfonema magnum]QTA91294.1 PPM-type phosphatase and HAMP domains-containing protein [Desulfonema magnum]
MFVFKSTRQKFYIIVGFLILLFCIVYAELAVFLSQLKTSSETGQISVTINNEIKELEKQFWKLRFWEKVVHTQSHPDAEKQFGITLENIKKSLSDLDPKLFTDQLSDKTLKIFHLMISYREAFNRLRQFETDRKLNQTQIHSNYQVLASTILLKGDTALLRTVRNLDRFLYAYLKSRRDSQYQAFRIVFKLFKGKLSKSQLADDSRMQSYVTKLDGFISRDFELEKEIRKINKHFDQISIELTNLLSDISQTSEKLSTEAILTGERLRNTLQQWFLISAGTAFILLVFILNIIAQKIVNPIRQLSEVVTQIKSGNDQARFFAKSEDEIAELGFAMNEMLDTIKEHHYHLEELVEKRTEELKEKNTQLNESLKQVEKANEKIMASIQYAQIIQRSLLPNPENIKTFLSDSFFVWMPKDIVGGDIFFTDCFEDGFIIAVIDCTGHGVPGAFMTMLASSGLRRIIKDEGCRDPARILKRLNFIVKTTLQQDTENAASDDGMDVAICFVQLAVNTEHLTAKEKLTTGRCSLTFAGAKLPLTYICHDKITVIKGDRQSIGYKQSRKSDINFSFTNHTVRIKKGMRFYLRTDGFEDQLGKDSHNGSRLRRFGSKRLKNLLRENNALPLEKQRVKLLESFEMHRRGTERQDDVTMVGFSF